MRYPVVNEPSKRLQKNKEDGCGKCQNQIRPKKVFTAFNLRIEFSQLIYEPTERWVLRERPLMTYDIRVGRGVQDSPQNCTL